MLPDAGAVRLATAMAAMNARPAAAPLRRPTVRGPALNAERARGLGNAGTEDEKGMSEPLEVMGVWSGFYGGRNQQAVVFTAIDSRHFSDRRAALSKGSKSGPIFSAKKVFLRARGFQRGMGGFSHEATPHGRGCSVAAVHREIAFARAFLLQTSR